MTNYKPTGSISACSPDKWKEHSHTTGLISACAPNKADYAINLNVDKSENWSPVLHRNLTLEEVKEEELKYIIDTLYVETKGLNLEIHSKLVDEKSGRYEMYADVDEGDDFTKFTVSKEDMKFIMDKLCEIKSSKEETKPSKEDSKHYTSDPSGVECIQITRHRNFNIGNAIKYLWRAGLKESNSDIQDLEKAIWYINDEIKRLKGEYNK